jgi:hypothetical protein
MLEAQAYAAFDPGALILNNRYRLGNRYKMAVRDVRAGEAIGRVALPAAALCATPVCVARSLHGPYRRYSPADPRRGAEPALPGVRGNSLCRRAPLAQRRMAIVSSAALIRHTVAGAMLQVLRRVAMESKNNALKTVGGRFFVPAPWLV